MNGLFYKRTASLNCDDKLVYVTVSSWWQCFTQILLFMFFSGIKSFLIRDGGCSSHSSLLISDSKKPLKHVYFCDLFHLMAYLIFIGEARLLYKDLSTMQTYEYW